MGSTTIFVTHDQAEAMSLADRIIVMNNGVIEQVGTPMEIYRDSATRFVASFIGTPPTNFFKVTIEKTAGGYAAEGGSLRYNIPEHLEKAAAAYAGKAVELGVRPEFISVSPELNRLPGYLCDADIRFVEPQGSYSILIADIGEEVKIVTTDQMDLPANTRVSLNVKDAKAMLFDMETGLRIR